jgi:hypothetical protein
VTAAPAPTISFLVRPDRETDRALIYSSFLHSMRDEDPFSGIGNDVFYETMKGACSAMLASFTTLIAHPEDDPDEIAGYLIFKADTIGFLYTKKDPWRRLGAARKLLEASRLSARATLRILFPTSKGMKLARLKGIEARACRHVEALALLARAA